MSEKIRNYEGEPDVYVWVPLLGNGEAPTGEPGSEYLIGNQDRVNRLVGQGLIEPVNKQVFTRSETTVFQHSDIQQKGGRGY